MVESSAETIYTAAVNEDVALLVVGDPLCATTHTDMMIRAREVVGRLSSIASASNRFSTPGGRSSCSYSQCVSDGSGGFLWVTTLSIWANCIDTLF
jgi:hypothetical protein